MAGKNGWFGTYMHFPSDFDINAKKQKVLALEK
jgi:hypothetical protein